MVPIGGSQILGIATEFACNYDVGNEGKDQDDSRVSSFRTWSNVVSFHWDRTRKEKQVWTEKSGAHFLVNQLF